MKNRLEKLGRVGQSVWLDSLSKKMLDDGTLKRMIEEDAVVGVTSNPTIFQKALAEGQSYDADVRAIAAGTGARDAREIFQVLAGSDVRRACALFRPTFDRSHGVDGFVSWEVDPDLAHDSAATVREATNMRRSIEAPPNLFIKIPATDAGVVAIEECVAAGYNINVTLLFSLARHQQVMDAYMAGLERYAAAGGAIGTVSSVASFFVSRIDTEVDRRLAALDRPELKGKTAVACAKLAYDNWRASIASARWRDLWAQGGRAQRCLWASTSAKNPAYRDVVYVEELVGPDTITTLPLETLQAFRAHGVVLETLVEGVDQARRTLDDVSAAGVDLDDVAATLEREGIKKFSDSFRDLRTSLDEKVARAVGGADATAR